MDFNQIAQRIFRRHAVLIAAFLLVGVAAALLVHRGDVRQYTAVTRLALDTPDPKSPAESLAVADAARAIVTSPSQVRTALSKSGATRDPSKVARKDVQLDQLGSSAILQLSVRDRDPSVASSLANTLAAQLIQTRLDLRRGAAIRLASQLDSRIEGLGEQVQALDKQIAGMQARALAAGPNGSPSLNADLSELRGSRAALADQKSELETARSQLTASDAMLPEASVIDPATPPTQADPLRLPHDLALGILLGLTLGICAAAFAESLRPSLVGGNAVARALDAPLIGTLARSPDRGDCISGERLVALLARLQLVAGRAKVRRVALVSATAEVNPVELATRLQEVVQLVQANGDASRQGVPRPAREDEARSPTAVGDRSELDVLQALYNVRERNPVATGDHRHAGEVAATRPARLRDVRVFDAAEPPLDDAPDPTGFAMVVPSPIASAQLRLVVDALALTGWPLLGIIAYPRRVLRPERVLAGIRTKGQETEQ